MQIEPQATAFAKRYARGEAQVVWSTLVSDLETPVSAFLKIAGTRPLSFLLESVEGGALRGRYSIIGLNPDLVWRTVGGRAEINRSAQQSAGSFTPCGRPPLTELRAVIAESRIELPDVLPPMATGIFGYLGYDMVRLMEELPAPNPDPIGIPDAVLMRPTVVVVFDTVKDLITLVTPVRPESGVSAETAFARASKRLSAIVDALDAPLEHSPPDVQAGPLTVWPSSNVTPSEYERMVNAAKEYIRFMMEKDQYGMWLSSCLGYWCQPLKAYSKMKFWDSDPKLKPFAGALDSPFYNGYKGPVSAASAAVTANYTIVDMFASVVTGSTTPEAAAKQAARAAERYYRKA